MANLLCLVAFDSEAPSGQSRITSTSKEPVNYNINFDGMDLLHRPTHGGLLSLNAWKLSPTPRKIEMVTYTHSNEPDNRCPLEPAVHEGHKT